MIDLAVVIEVPHANGRAVTVIERLDRLDRYCDALEQLIALSDVEEEDDDITGQIERTAAGLEVIDRHGRRLVRE
jgi:hypothetical protein